MSRARDAQISAGTHESQTLCVPGTQQCNLQEVYCGYNVTISLLLLPFDLRQGRFTYYGHWGLVFTLGKTASKQQL